MQVKTFEALSVKDAVKAVKTEFGNQAVILKTREKMLNDQKVYEVTAAINDTGRAGGAATMTSDGGVEAGEIKQLEDRLESLEVKIGHIDESMVRKNQISSLEVGLEELKCLMMETLRNKDGSHFQHLTPPQADIAQRLQLMGLEESVLAPLIKYLTELPPYSEAGPTPGSESEREYVKSHAIKWMLKRIKIAPRLQPSSGSVAVHAFVGPSGSGKTSLVAKVAANAAKQFKCKVLLLSFDHKRLAAAEQLRVYAKILNMGFDTLDDPRQLATTIHRHGDAELVFIDTAGVSPKNQARISELQDIGKHTLPVAFDLVLSVTEKQQQLDRCVRSFAPLNISSLSFTKLDESWSYGEILNLCHKWSLPLSFFSVGQRIPDDVERASKERVIERVFEL